MDVRGGRDVEGGRCHSAMLIPANFTVEAGHSTTAGAQSSAWSRAVGTGAATRFHRPALHEGKCKFAATELAVEPAPCFVSHILNGPGRCAASAHVLIGPEEEVQV